MTGAAGTLPAAGPELAEALAGSYRLIAEWFLYPEEIDPATVTEEAVAEAVTAAETIDPELGRRLLAFHAGRGAIGPEEYLSLLELNPHCPLYMGSYQFQEPTTCSAAGVSERNQYMLEIGNVYRHFGFMLRSELPDFLPAMTEFLALTAGSEGEDRELRLRFVERMVWPGVRLFATKLGEQNTPYAELAEGLLICLQRELGKVPELADREVHDIKPSQLIQLEMASGKRGEPR